jgi:hypothetical protein
MSVVIGGALMCLWVGTTAAEWPHDPLENVPVCLASGGQDEQQIVSDGAGGAIITWEDARGADRDVYAQRVDVTGTVLWTADGVLLCTAPANQVAPKLVPDGAGGAVIVWMDYRNDTWADIYAQRVDASGGLLWGSEGVAICTAASLQYAPDLVSDNASGAIIAWRDQRGGEFFDIYAQRVDASGAVLWGPDGTPVSTAPGDQDGQQLIADGSGGAIIVWADLDFEDGGIYAQRVNASGAGQWGGGGVAICTEGSGQHEPQLVSDGAGGAIIAWIDYRNDIYTDVYAQRVDASGAVHWTSDGVAVCTAAQTQEDQQLAPDGEGGTIIVWMDRRAGSGDENIYAQRMSVGGAPQWSGNGVDVCTATGSQRVPQLVSDGAGGAVVTWHDNRNGGSTNDIYAQRLDGAGEACWVSDGAPVCTAASSQFDPQIASDGSGEAIITWNDYREGGATGYDIYAQLVERNGFLGRPSPTITEVADYPDDQGSVAVVSWAPSYLDAYPDEVVTHYSVWMRMPEASRAAPAGVGQIGHLVEETGLPFEAVSEMLRSGWAHVEDVPAYYYDEYACNAPTYGDSTESGVPLTEYQVVAHAADHWVFWVSDVAAGYSVDNLAPGAPLALAAEQAYTDVELSWSPSGQHDEDLLGYNVYRSHVSGFVPGETTFVGSTAATGFVDSEPGGGIWHYLVTAEDVHGNEGPPSNEASSEAWAGVGDPVLPVAFALWGSRPNPFSAPATIAFDVPAGGGDVKVRVYDVSGRGVRVLVDGHQSPGRKLVTWDGTDEAGRPVASGVYYCRMEAPGHDESVKMTLIR